MSLIVSCQREETKQFAFALPAASFEIATHKMSWEWPYQAHFHAHAVSAKMAGKRVESSANITCNKSNDATPD